MKHHLLALVGCATTTLAWANPDFKNVPPSMQKSLHGISAAQFDGGVLRAQMNKPEVTELVYNTFVFHNICAQQWHDPAQFARLGLTRVELFNAAGTQGFAFDARGDVCEEMGKLGKNFRTFIGQYTQVCSASTCPPQR